MSEPATFALATAALDPASSRPGHGPSATTDEGALLRLALWLAEVSAEAVLVATAPAASSTPGAEAKRRTGEAKEPPAVETLI